MSLAAYLRKMLTNLFKLHNEAKKKKRNINTEQQQFPFSHEISIARYIGLLIFTA